MNVIVYAIPVLVAPMAAQFGLGRAISRSASRSTLPTYCLAHGLIGFCVLPRSLDGKAPA